MNFTRPKAPKPAPTEIVVALQGFYFHDKTTGLDIPILAGEEFRGSHPATQAVPQMFASRDTTPTERQELLRERFPLVLPGADKPTVHLAKPLPIERQRVALRPISTQAGFLPAGAILDAKHPLVKANPKDFGPVADPSPVS